MIKKAGAIIFYLVLLGCANQMAPTGGPADKTPPVLKESNPANNQKNYSGKTIELTFNENVQLNNAKEEILSNPVLGKKTKYIARGKKVVITPENELLPNTTYSFTFREGIKDITEGNAAENLRLAFSTGPVIDSLQIQGVITDHFKKTKADKITVALYSSDTFDIFKHQPTYFNLTNKNGEYLIANLKAGKYFVYAFDDKNKNLKVDSQTERFGFGSTEVDLTNKDTVNISIYRVDARPIKVISVRNATTISSIRFNKPVDSVQILQKRPSKKYRLSNTRNEIVADHRLNNNDSIPIRIIAFDSVHQKLDSTLYIKSSQLKFVNEQFKVTTTRTEYNSKSQQYEALFETNKPIQTIVHDSIKIVYDSLHQQTIKQEEIKYDTLYNRLTIRTKLIDSLINKKETKLIFSKSSLLSNDNDSIKSISTEIRKLEAEQTSTLSIEVQPSKPNYVLELLRENDSIVKRLFNPTKHTFDYLTPGTYRIRIIIDTNKNGKWDGGNFYSKTPAEEIVFYENSEKQRDIPTRANWEVGPLVIKF